MAPPISAIVRSIEPPGALSDFVTGLLDLTPFKKRRSWRPWRFRRVDLIESRGAGTILIGIPGGADVVRLQGFLTRSGYPNVVVFDGAGVSYWASPIEARRRADEDPRYV
jgi:hypothetical protein